MPFTISYNITAIDKFSKVSKKIVDSAKDLDSTFGKVSKSSVRAGNGMSVVAKAAKAAEKSIKKAKKETAAARKASAKAAKIADKATADNRRAGERLINTQKGLERSTNRVKLANERLASTQKRLSIRAKQQEIAATRKQIKLENQLTRAKERAAQKAMAQRKARTTAIGGAAAGVGRVGMRAGTGLAVGAGASIKMAMDFNKSMASVATLIPEQAEKLNRYKKAVQELSIETGIGTEIMSEGLYQVISAVGDTDDAMKVLELSSKAAVAGVSTTKDAVNLLTKVSTAYEDNSAGMIERVSDLSFLAVKLGVTTFPELANSMGKIAATSNAMDVSMVELYADTAALTKVMGDTSQAATSMDAVMGALMQGSGKLDDAFARLGVKSGKELIQTTGGLQNALMALKKSVGGDEVALAQMFGRKEAQKAAQLLTGSLYKEARRNMKAMGDAAGSTTEAFKEQTEDVNKMGHRWEQTKKRMVVAAQNIGERLLPVLEKVLDKLEPFFKWLEKLDDEAIKNAVEIAALAGKYLLLFGAIGKVVQFTSGMSNFLASMAGGAGTASGALGKLSGIMGALGPIIASFGAGWAFGDYFMKQWEKIEAIRNERKNLEAQNQRKMAQTDYSGYKQSSLTKLRGIQQETIASIKEEQGGWFMSDADKEDLALRLDTAQRNLSAMNQEFERRQGMIASGEAQYGKDGRLEILVKAADGTEVESATVKNADYANVDTGKN